MAAVTQQSYGQVCSPGAIKRWTGTANPGDLAVGQAGHTGTNLFAINGTILDWSEHITGPLNPAYTAPAPPAVQPNPFSSPVSGPNVQQDGYGIVAGPDYDRDRPQAGHRDLRYFAFTFDRANSYFFFRRAVNASPQVAYYYLVDINLDGHMRNGEPVIKVNYNGSTASLEMGYFIEHADQVNDGTSAPGNHVINKGNAMVATIARVAGNSEWTVGAADGWSVDGDFDNIANGQLPALTTVGGVQEVWGAAAINDGPNSGYAVEFSVPWNYLRLYDGAGAAPAPYDASYNPMTYLKVFSYHVSTQNGGGGNLNGAEDNVGGCCSGLAFSGNANTDLTSQLTVANGNPSSQYRIRLTYTEQLNFSTNVTLPQIIFSNVVTFGVVTPNPTTYTVRVYPADGAGNPILPGTLFSYSNQPNATSWAFTGVPVMLTASPLGTAKFVVDVDFGGPPYKTKSATVTVTTDNAFNVASLNCVQLGTTGDNIPVGILTPLPVSFKSFTATRNNSNVMVKWETATEINNSGFAVERNINGTWEQVGFVPSQATSGTSTSDLSYQFIDLNNTKGITQYRLKQIDIDAKFKYSDVRAVRGDGQIGKTIVYPNPSSDGKVNIVFEDANLSRDISVSDMSGRTVKQLKGVTANNITIDNLTPGMYSLRIVIPSTGDQSVEKIMVNKR